VICCRQNYAGVHHDWFPVNLRRFIYGQVYPYSTQCKECSLLLPINETNILIAVSNEANAKGPSVTAKQHLLVVVPLAI